MTYTLDWSETDLGGSAVVSYGLGAVLDYADKPAGATAALSITAFHADSSNTTIAEFSIVTTGSSVMTFDYRTSTESGYDKLHIDVDGVSQAEYSGVTAWTTHAGISIASAGTHTIRFRYQKDSGSAANADRVWVALLNITNTTTTNDASGTVDTYDFEDGATPSFITTSSWTNSTSGPITGTRSMRSPASPAGSGSYDLEIEKAAGSDYATVGFDYKTDTESGWDKLFIFPDAAAANVPASGEPSTPGDSGWIAYSGSTSGRIALILPAAAQTVLLRYTKDGGGDVGADAVWIDTLKMPAAGGADLTAADSAHGHSTESPTLTQVHELAPSDAAHGHAADSPTLTQAHELAPADSSHGHATEAPTLTQAGDLAPADSAHAHASESPTLTQTHALSPADSLHGHGSESPTLAQAGDLAAADSSHTHTADSPALTQVHQLAPADSSHGHASDSPALTQAHELTAADSVHGHTTESPTTTTGTTLVPADSAHAHAAGQPAVTQLHLLDPARTVHAHATELAALTQAHELAALDSLLTHTSDSPTLASFEPAATTPAERTIVVPAEDRTIVVPAENRTITVPSEDRRA